MQYLSPHTQTNYTAELAHYVIFRAEGRAEAQQSVHGHFLKTALQVPQRISLSLLCTMFSTGTAQRVLCVLLLQTQHPCPCCTGL